MLTAPINANRFLADLDALREIGRCGKGVVRPALSEADMAARRWLADKFTAIGLETRYDPVGNLFGLPTGDSPCLLVGSHTDSQPEGGWLDGALGTIAALEAARALQEADLPPIALVSFQDEEGRFGGLLGSDVFTGGMSLSTAEARRDQRGVRLSDLRDAYPELRNATPLSPDRFTGFLEAHIEQGLELDSRGEQIAVVDAIAGAREALVVFKGEQNHAGATRMDRRRDCMRGLAEAYAAIDAALAPLLAEASVWTIGQADLMPNASSIIPGEVHFTVQWRDVDNARLDAMETAILGAIEGVAARLALECNVKLDLRIAPSLMNERMTAHIETAAAKIAPARWRRLSSGAMHDAMRLSRIMPSGMIFAPSIGGLSHCFDEDTKREDLVACAQVVAETAALWVSNES